GGDDVAAPAGDVQGGLAAEAAAGTGDQGDGVHGGSWECGKGAHSVLRRRPAWLPRAGRSLPDPAGRPRQRPSRASLAAWTPCSIASAATPTRGSRAASPPGSRG